MTRSISRALQRAGIIRLSIRSSVVIKRNGSFDAVLLPTRNVVINRRLSTSVAPSTQQPRIPARRLSVQPTSISVPQQANVNQTANGDDSLSSTIVSNNMEVDSSNVQRLANAVPADSAIHDDFLSSTTGSNGIGMNSDHDDQIGDRSEYDEDVFVSRTVESNDIEMHSSSELQLNVTPPIDADQIGDASESNDNVFVPRTEESNDFDMDSGSVSHVTPVDADQAASTSHSNYEVFLSPTVASNDVEMNQISPLQSSAEQTDNDDQVACKTAFPGHTFKKGRKSYFTRNEMDNYVNQFQPPRRRHSMSSVSRPPLSRMNRMSLDSIPEEITVETLTYQRIRGLPGLLPANGSEAQSNPDQTYSKIKNLLKTIPK